MAGTTSLEDLPVSPQSEGNIQLQTTETNANVKIDSTINEMQTQRQAEIAVPNKPSIAGTGGPTGLGENVNKFVSGVQEAVAAGALGLESRDVPQSQTHLTQDVQMQPNFVPTHEQEDYIGKGASSNDMIREHNEKKKAEDSFDILFNNLQTPVLLALLYFIFQLPSVKQSVFRLIPSLFRKDGTPNLYGYVVHAVSFASLYQALTLTLQYFSI